MGYLKDYGKDPYSCEDDILPEYFHDMYLALRTLYEGTGKKTFNKLNTDQVNEAMLVLKTCFYKFAEIAFSEHLQVLNEDFYFKASNSIANISHSAHNALNPHAEHFQKRMDVLNIKLDNLDVLYQAAGEVLGPLALTSSNSALRERVQQIFIENNINLLKIKS